MTRDGSGPGNLPRPAGVVGVMALQGGFEAHGRMLSALGASVREVRVPDDLCGLAALVLPGGESTTMMLGIERERLADPLREFVRSGRPVLATCAGAIVLDDSHLGLIDLTCERNAYGGQVHSFEAALLFDGFEAARHVTPDGLESTESPDRPEARTFAGVFIRAPRFVRVGQGVRTLARFNGDPVAVRDGAVLAMSFHPELTDDDRIHRLFLESIPVDGVTNVSEINKLSNISGRQAA